MAEPLDSEVQDLLDHQLPSSGWKLRVQVWWIVYVTPWICRLVSHEPKRYSGLAEFVTMRFCDRCKRPL